MNEIIIIILLLTSAGLVGVCCILNRDKTQAIKKYKKLQKEKVDDEIKMLKSLKGDISPKTSDDIIKNIMNSRNTLLENALKDDFTEADICSKFRKDY
ncbi:conserved hypothetical protein [Methanocaldococcus sp. FS406-22]|uniref:hypothetical protein n=1 Tax=Methanocaldococcus sp. (strain FS406-22) TaxID=644281 RepID=UPI0001BF34E7|nr:hypothetical protein [Methanocaldococcus sp. FS406-22]ADC70434.1 conserved hypothetical protein [Methanocaldococcus sp. FS406-22]